jgi:hypothetical protein
MIKNRHQKGRPAHENRLKGSKCRELIAGYEDKAEEGVRGYGGRLNIRPPYQREFIYKEKTAQ